MFSDKMQSRRGFLFQEIDMPDNPVLTAALAYQKQGYQVIPLTPNQKTPRIKEWQKARWGVFEINDWWGQNPADGIGIITGNPSGISVCDLDGPHAFQLLKDNGITPPKTRSVKTPHGRHLYYEYDGDFGQGAGFLKADCECEKSCAVDGRNDGGYVVAPPTPVDGYEYTVTDEPIAPFGEVPTYLMGKTGTKGTAERLPASNQPKWIADALINGAPQGQRNDMASRLAGYFHSKQMGADVIEATLRTFADNCTPPMDYGELAEVIKSVARYTPKPFQWQGEHLPAPETQFLTDNRARFHWEAQGLTIILERVRLHGETAPCLLTVMTADNGTLYGPIRFDLFSGTQRTTARRAMPDLYPWEGYFNYLASLVREHFTQIEPTIDLSTVVPKGEGEWLIEPLIRGTKPYICFGDGGAGKSTFCTMLGLILATGKELIPNIKALTTGNSLYLDYEQEEEDVAATMQALARGADVTASGIIYQRMSGPVIDHTEQIKRTVKEHSIRLLIVDHIVAACGGDAKDEDSARVFFAALRDIGVATIAIGHVAKGNDKTVYGSTFWTNFARGMFKIEGFQEPESNVNHVELYNTKNNRGTLMRPMAYDVTYEGNGNEQTITFRNADIQSDSQTAKSLGWVERISAVLKHGAMTAGDIATEIDESRETVSRELGRAGRKGTHWQMLIGTQKWGLLEHHIPRDIPRDIPTPPPYGGLGVVGNGKEETKNPRREMPWD